MAAHILRCPADHGYTLEKTCPQCKRATESSRPPKFSLDDKYGPYRRKIKKEEWERKDLY